MFNKYVNLMIFIESTSILYNLYWQIYHLINILHDSKYTQMHSKIIIAFKLNYIIIELLIRMSNFNIY